MLETFDRLYHTVRHLKPVQIYGRIWFRLWRPRPDFRSAPELRPYGGGWQLPVRKGQSMLGPGRFSFLNLAHDIETQEDWNSPHLSKLWMYNLHYFDDLNAIESEKRTIWHRELIERWIIDNPPVLGNGWEPYTLSLRIVNWIKWDLAGNQLSESARQSLAVQVRYLQKRLEYHLLGNHLLANAKALVFSGLYFSGPEADTWLNKGLEILGKELPEQVLADGGHFERSPMYHAIILEDLLDLINLLSCYQQPLPSAWTGVAEKMLLWAELMKHPDGEIVLFNDAAFGIAAKPADLFAYARLLNISLPELPASRLNCLEASGYLCIKNAELDAFLDVAPIGPDYLPGHAHADSLSYELSFFGQRLVVDSGTSCYGTSSERLRQRGTAAHNTLTLNGENSSEVWGGFRVAKRAYPVDLVIQDETDKAVVSCAHSGYRWLPGKPTHQRKWVFAEKSVGITDTVKGPYSSAVSRVYFHPEVEVVADAGAKSGSVILPNGESINWQVVGARCEITQSTWHPEFGVSIANSCLEMSLDDDEATIHFSW